MAALDSVGFPVQVASGGGQPLANLAPLQFNQSKLDIQPLAGWSIPSSHPEYVAQGLAQGAGAIAQGIQVAYKSRQEQKLRDAQNKRDDMWKQQEEKDRMTQQGIENKRLDMQGLNIESEIANRGGNKGNSKLPPAYSLDQQSQDQAPEPASNDDDQQHINDLSQPLDGSKPVDDSELPIDSVPNTGQGNATPKTSNLFSNLTSAVPIAAAPSPTGQMALSALANNPPSSIPAEGKSASLAGAIPSAVAWPSPTLLRVPDQALKPTGALADPKLTGALSSIGNYLDSPNKMPGGFQENAAIEKIIGVPARVTPEDYQKIVKYANEKGIVAPATAHTESPDGTVTLEWPSPDVVEQHAARVDQAKDRQEVAKDRVAQRTQAILNQELNGFNSNNDVKVFTSQNGMRQSFPKFMKDYEAISENPTASGISDIGLMDMYAKAESGSRVSDSQLHAVLQAQTLKQKYETLFNKQFVGGDQLNQAQRDQMAQVLAGDHQAQVDIANQAVHMARNRLIAQGVTDEKFLPQPYIPAVTKSDVNRQISTMRDQAIKLKDQRDALQASGDVDGAAKLDSQLEEIGSAAKALVEKKKKAKGFVVNMDDIQGKDQGWGGAAATTLIDHE